MRNFSIQFTNSPWLLLLLIPAIALALWPYLRISKRFRRTRNRVCSLVLHIIILVLCITVLSGMQFTYETNDSKNEIVLLVDVSFSSEEDSTVKEERNEFIQDILDANHRQCKIGIVTFGFTQVKAADLSYDVNQVYSQYEKAELPDISGTDIASALKFVWNPTESDGIFSDPDHGKIVLISDGLETDGDAMAVIRDLAADGVRVDTVCFSPRQKYDVQVTGIQLPERNIEVDKEFEVTFSLQTSVTGMANYSLVDEFKNDFGEAVQSVVPSKQVEMGMGSLDVKFTHKFTESGIHKLYLQMESEVDTITFNNQYYAYYELFIHDKVLLVERYDGESSSLNDILNVDLHPGENEFKVDTVNLEKPEGDSSKQWVAAPRNLSQLREYDQVILMNISHADFKLIDDYRAQVKQGDEVVSYFEDDLYQYVREYGGGLFTIGGYERDEYNEVAMDPVKTATPLAHTYVREDMKGTRYQELLPVNIDSYTPPVAVQILIDISDGMNEMTSLGMTKFELAKRAALACLDALSSRDYCEVGYFGETFGKLINLTPATQKVKLESAIRSLTASNSEKRFTAPIERAGRELYNDAGNSVENKHIIMITDDTIPDMQTEDPDDYMDAIRTMYGRYGVTMSIAGIDLGPKTSYPVGYANPYTVYQQMADLTNSYFYQSDNIAQIADYMVEDLRQSTMIGVISKSFTPKISSRTAAVTGVTEDHLPRIGGFFVTRAKTTGDVKVALVAESVPLYAQWDFGKGRVGSFMCDLGAYFAMNFVESSEGIKVLNNVVHDLMPGEDIRAKEVDALLIEDNYTTTVSIYTDLDAGEMLEWSVIQKPWVGAELGTEDAEPGTDVWEGVITSGSAKRFSFKNMKAGIYQITVIKRDAAGLELARLETYRNFSYSREYDVFRDTDEGLELMTNLATNGDGRLVESVPEIYENFVDLVETFDPRLLFMILALILFLLDIAVRKFKFKWPHEIIQSYREKRNQANS